MRYYEVIAAGKHAALDRPASIYAIYDNYIK